MEETIIDLDGADRAALSRDKSGIVIRSSLTGEGYYLYDGQTVEPYVPLPEEEITDDNRQFRFLDLWAYQDAGVIFNADTGQKIVDLKDKNLSVICGCANGSRLLIRNSDNAQAFIMQCLDGNDLLSLADGILGGRQLTPEEKARYFIE